MVQEWYGGKRIALIIWQEYPRPNDWNGNYLSPKSSIPKKHSFVNGRMPTEVHTNIYTL